MNFECPWKSLKQELDAWADQGNSASLWWRDDDAVAAGPKLGRLLDLTAATGLLLAVIPSRAQHSLMSMLTGLAHVRVAQHGYAHVNHAPRGQGLGAWELGLHRGEVAVLNDLDRGRKLLEDMFETVFLPVLVPPWNRIDHALFEAIAERQYRAVSAFGPRAVSQPFAGFWQVNAHCDPIRWKGGAHFAGEQKTLEQLTGHLRARRKGDIDAHEPTGFLTHHIDLDAAGWAFCEQLIASTCEHPGAHWRYPDSLFSGEGVAL